MAQTHRPSRPKLMPNAVYPGMWLVQWPDGPLSDMANLARAKDAVACFIETEERRQRGRQSQLEARLCVKACAGDEEFQIHLPEGKRPCTGMSEIVDALACATGEDWRAACAAAERNHGDRPRRVLTQGDLKRELNIRVSISAARSTTARSRAHSS
jgi:hypothetical protein